MADMHPRTYLGATKNTLQAGIDDSYKSVDLDDDQQAVLEDALEIVEHIEHETFPASGKGVGDDE